MSKDTDTVVEATQELGTSAAEESAAEDTYHSRIMIKPNGEVIIENLSMDLVELAMMLDPESEVACTIPGLEDPNEETSS